VSRSGIFIPNGKGGCFSIKKKRKKRERERFENFKILQDWASTRLLAASTTTHSKENCRNRYT
jgi:hypothetical protein